MTISPGQTLTLEVSKIVHGGYGLARADGRVIFILGAIPGEILEVVITEVKKSLAYADVIRVVEPSPHRIPHIWPEADVSRKPHDRVGGADFGHMAIDYQRVVKRDVIREALARQGDVEQHWLDTMVVHEVPGEADGTRWRTRVALHVDDGGRVGPRAFRSHRVIPTATLPLAHPDLAPLITTMSAPPGATTIHLGRSSTGQVWTTANGERALPVTEIVAGHTFTLNSDVFWQVHHSAAETLFGAVSRAISEVVVDPTATNLDLYGGVGLFAVALAQAGGEHTRVVSVEANQAASQFAAENLSAWRGVSSQASDVLAYLRAEISAVSEDAAARYRAATVVLDPPRSGAGAGVTEAIIALSPAHIVYVACDPVAFARDQKMLRQAGYQLSSLEAFDLFPHTHHVEMVAGFIHSRDASALP